MATINVSSCIRARKKRDMVDSGREMSTILRRPNLSFFYFIIVEYSLILYFTCHKHKEKHLLTIQILHLSKTEHIIAETRKATLYQVSTCFLSKYICINILIYGIRQRYGSVLHLQSYSAPRNPCILRLYCIIKVLATRVRTTGPRLFISCSPLWYEKEETITRIWNSTCNNV